MTQEQALKIQQIDLAEKIYVNAMATAHGMDTISSEKRKALFKQVADLAFEMSEVFLESAKEFAEE